MKIHFGVVKQSAAWEQLCQQEGVTCEAVEPARSALAEDFSVLIINRMLDLSERNIVAQYLRHGGAVIGYAPYLSDLAGTPSRKERLDYLVADEASGMFDLSVLDTGVVGHIPGEANLLRTQNSTYGMFAGELSGGPAVLLPFDVADLFTDTRAANKRFYSDRERLPAERVSAVAKSELRHLLHRSFEYLHHARSVPYVHVWYFPGGEKNVFAFRVDTDAGQRDEIDDLYSIAKETGSGFSWFLDVRSHEPWLNHFLYMAGQEIGIHCYEHQTFPTYEANLRNIARARHAMESSGLPSESFAAPFGMWNPGLAQAIDELGFAYSSEFSVAYDTLPLYPEAVGTIYNTLQVPIHPVSIGSLRRVGYSEVHMRNYYRAVIDRKLARAEPLFFYHHPSHHCWETVRFMIRYAQEKGIETVTMGEYARWWKRRLMVKCSADVSETDVRVAISPNRTDGDDFWVRISKPPGFEAIVRASSPVDLERIEWHPMNLTHIPPDIRRTRDFDPRDLVADLYSDLMRKFK